MNILQLISINNWTGPADSVLSISKKLIERGHNVVICCRTRPKGNLIERIEKTKIRFENKVKLSKGFNIKDFLNDIFVLKKLIKDQKIELVNCHLSRDHILGLFLKIIYRDKIRVVRTVHNSKVLNRSLLQGMLLRLSDGIITVCNNYKNSLVNRFKLDSKKIGVIYGAVDHERFKPGLNGKPLKEMFKIDPSVKVIGMVARFQSHRGHEYLLKAFPAVKEIYPNTKVALVGKGEYRETIEKLLKEISINDDVVFYGYREDDLPQVYASMNVKVLLEEGNDGSCRAILEAMSCGLPIVGVNKGAVAETIENGVSGFLVKKDNTDDLSERLVEILKDDEKAKAMGKRGREIVEKRFTEDIRASQIEEFYKKIGKE